MAGSGAAGVGTDGSGLGDAPAGYALVSDGAERAGEEAAMGAGAGPSLTLIATPPAGGLTSLADDRVTQYSNAR